MWNYTHFRHPTDEQLRHVDIYFIATTIICSLSTLNRTEYRYMRYTLFLKWHDRYQLANKRARSCPSFFFYKRGQYNTVWGRPWQGLKNIPAEGASARTTLSLGRGMCGRGSADPLWGREGLVNLLEREKKS